MEYNYIPEKKLKNHPSPISSEALEIIQSQMKKSICKIQCDDESSGTGFFARIPFPDCLKLLPVLITNHHVINDKINNYYEIIFPKNNQHKAIKLFFDESRRFYTNRDYDITIIEIKEKDNIDLDSYLEIDEKKENPKIFYKKKEVYLMQFPNGGVNYISGIIKNINEDNYTIEHLCSTERGSSGSPILNLLNYKVIGIHKGTTEIINFEWNLGTLI